MDARRCSACGATVTLAPGARSTTCAFCDSALVDDTAAAEPVDRVVPFTVPRPRAAELLRGHLAAQWFAPESLRRAARTDELRDVLVPFWVFDAVARTTFSATIGIDWYRTETYTVTVNGKTQTRTRQVRETEWFPLSGSHVRQWTDHLVSASRGLAEREANALEPFDLGRGRPYADALVAGLTAEMPTVPRAEAEPLARKELAQLEHRVIASGHLPGNHHRSLSSETVSTLEPPRLYLLPVWIASVKGPKGPVRLLVNGQTGEVVGAVPTSWWKVAAAVAVVIALVLGVVGVVLFGGTVLGLLGALLEWLR
jgi:hypothetical protein